MMRRLLLSAGMVFTLLAGTVGCYEERLENERLVEQSWPAESVSEIRLKSVNGTIEVRTTEEPRVILRAEVRTDHDNPEPIKFDVSGGTLDVREKWTERRIFPFFRHGVGRVRYEILVPEQTDLDLTTTNGRITSQGVRGEHDFRSVNGRIEVSTPDAELAATTVNGRIEARFTEQFRGARLRTVNGSVRVWVPEGTEIAADVDQVNGSFNSSLPVIVNGRSSSDRAPLEVTTVNGSVTLEQIEGALASGE
ncbi:MAG TPA: DUF4097 family beta strand repeat-containing protein [Thermoanaerobaculia bacterium]|nr:DUF4097 family beta strand repeat-containing protein [Thermoanaerobaculia bacterium]